MGFKPLSIAYRPINLPCGQCVGCRLERSRQWAMRIMHESQLHASNCFITLTYSDENIPADGGLRKSDFQKFMKRLRKKVGSVRFFYAGEYGESLGRPHYHACIFGYDFPDKVPFSQSGEHTIYISDELSKLWPYGHVTIGELTFQSAAYVARYCMKKVTGDSADRHYEKICPYTGEIYKIQEEYVTMSLKPAIGRNWYDKYKTDLYPSDYHIVNGVKVRPPRYYDRLLKIENESLLEQLKFKRVRRALKSKEHQTPNRLRVREKVAKARLNQLTRHKEI